ncbi:TetR/AcrR family transcriptional regulator [Pelagicoccus sp. SDUM812003]|uniref:acrylate utilization transcriptional regulator AcuR n=1 Tax=Pelagicoccus sp. SDUM812003 TaxID=3041267 RepID=UPI00280D8092|nr:TetR/AcrR family transcriptional regulator [Pelagicoccus sp. SDUM812003]MDQ8203206.1 TetR/AcrR family transcriptional regulator [Pelagicoccus sp. SDUM812003]
MNPLDQQEAKAKRGRGRPARRPEESEARNRLVRVGLAYLTEKGYSPTGLNAVLREAGVPKGAFYHYFRDKEDFGLQLIEAYSGYFCRKLDRCFQDESRSAPQRLRAFVDEAASGMSKYGFRRGCLVGNLGQEMNALPEPFRAKLVATIADWERRTAKCLSEGQSEGSVSGSVDTERMARFFWIGWEGAVLRAKLERCAQPLEAFAQSFFDLINPKRG